SYGWMTGDPTVDAWNATTPTNLDVPVVAGAPNTVLNSQSYYLLIEDNDADNDGNDESIDSDATGSSFSASDDLIGLGYFSGLPGQLLVDPAGTYDGTNPQRQLLLRYIGSPADTAAIGASFGSLTLTYPGDAVNGPFLHLNGCPIETPMSFEIYFDGEGGTLTPHNKNNADLTLHDGNTDGTGDGGWEYAFAASPLGEEACTDPTPNNSEAFQSPHLSLVDEWEFTWELNAESDQQSTYSYEILLGGFDPTDAATNGEGYNETHNAQYGIANSGGSNIGVVGITVGDLQLVFPSSDEGLNDGTGIGNANMTLRPTDSPELVKVTMFNNRPGEHNSWGWANAVPPPNSDIWVMTAGSDLFGNPLTQGFEEEEVLAGAGVSGELFHLAFATPGIIDVVISTTDPNTGLTEPDTPGPIMMAPGETIYIGFEGTIPLDYQDTTPTGLTDCNDLWTDNGCDVEELFALFNDADPTNDPASFVFMDNELATSCNQSTIQQYWYFNFFGYGDPDSVAADSIDANNPTQDYIWFMYTADGTENFGQFGIGGIMTGNGGCVGGIYVDAANNWTDCEDQNPISVEAGKEEMNSAEEDYNVVALTGGNVLVNDPPNLVPNYVFFPPPPDLISWELFDPTSCSNLNTDGYSAGANSGAAGIDPLNEELIGGRFAIISDLLNSRISGPIDQVAFLVGNPKTSDPGDPNGDVLPPTATGSTFISDDLTWFYIDPDSAYLYPTNPATEIEVLFDIDDLFTEGSTTDANDSTVTYTEAPDGWYQNIRVAVRNSKRSDIFDTWTPQGSHDQFGDSGNDINTDNTAVMNWFLDEVVPVFEFATPDQNVFTPISGSNNSFLTNAATTWEFAFTVFDSVPSSGIKTRYFQVTGPTGQVYNFYENAAVTSFFYNGANTQGDGLYLLEAVAEDNACNVSAIDSLIIYLDSTPPADATAMAAFDTSRTQATVTTSPEFFVAIDFTPEIPNPYVPSLFAMPENNPPDSVGCGSMDIYWRQGPVGSMPVGP
ncbi:MAG: hypothetical protein GY869_30015, partial [Planctomycetes bacterium]|nr:hypothetical protein [Planctomycetota bacterium]